MPAQPPVDRFRLVYFVHFLLGASLLFPYNAFITVVDYFTILFPDVPVESYVTVAVTVPNLMALLVSLRFGRQVPFSARVWFGFLCFLGVLGATIAMVVVVKSVTTEEWKHEQSTFLALQMTMVALAGFATAILQGAVFGFAGMLPPLYTQAVMGGNGVAGVSICVIRLITKGVYSSGSFEDNRMSALLYFGVAAGVVLICLVLFQLATTLPFVKYYMRARARAAAGYASSVASFAGSARSSFAEEQPPLTEHGAYDVLKAEVEAALADHAAESAPLLSEDASDQFTTSPYVPPSPGRPLDLPPRRSSGSDGGLTPTSDLCPRTPTRRRPRKARVMSIIHQIGGLGFQVCFVFTLTLSVFPAVVVKIRSYYGDPHCWMGIITITLFNVGDLMGRLLAGWVVFLNERTLWIPVLGRLLFVPLFMIMADRDGIFGEAHNWVSYGVMLLFAISNGYLGSLAMMFGPSKVQSHEREMAGTFMVLCLTFGLALGAVLSLAMTAIIKDAENCVPASTG